MQYASFLKNPCEPYNPYERIYTTEEFWQNPLGAVSFERRITASFAMQRVRPSTHVLFTFLSSLAIAKPQGIQKQDGRFSVVKEGHRKYAQRGLAKACNLAVNTIRRGLKELEALGYINVATNSLGTIIEILGFERFKRPALSRVSRDNSFLKTRVSKIDPYRISSNHNLINTKKISVGMNEEDPILGPDHPKWHEMKFKVRDFVKNL